MITVHGLLGEPSPDLARAAAAADWVVGGSRYLDRLAVPEQRRITLGALSAAVTRIAALPESDDVVVIASGDPLHYGVVRSLRAAEGCVRGWCRVSARSPPPSPASACRGTTR